MSSIVSRLGDDTHNLSKKKSSQDRIVPAKTGDGAGNQSTPELINVYLTPSLVFFTSKFDGVFSLEKNSNKGRGFEKLQQGQRRLNRTQS